MLIDFYLTFINLFLVVPHITDAIQEWVMKQATVCVDDDGVEPEVCVIEVSSSQVIVLFLISLFVGIGTKQGILFFLLFFKIV